jgi:hypothetical protein
VRLLCAHHHAVESPARRRALTLSAAAAGALLIIVAVCSCGKAPSDATEQSQMRAISRAVFAGGRLWLLQDDGSLASLAPEEAKAQSVTTADRVLDICKSAGTVAVLIEGKGRWSLQVRSESGWNAVATVPTEGDSFVALDCEDGGGPVTAVTNRRLVELRGGGSRSTQLRQPLEPPFGMGTALGTPEAVWLGFNVGEWGGGLRRISRIDGTVEMVERNRSGQPCGGPLNSACDPVAGIIAAPWDPRCAIAAIGLVHIMAHGRIVEICGSKVRRLYFKPFDPQPRNGGLDDGEPASTVAFFGLARNGNTWWALGMDGLYRFDGTQVSEFRPLPAFEDKGGYSVSFAIPGLALVRTGVNQRRSLSGSVPIMAVR